MDFRAEKFIKNHKQPLVKLEIDGLKLSTSSNSQEEKNRVENALSTLKTALCVDRVERRSALLEKQKFQVAGLLKMLFQVRTFEMQVVKR